MYKPGDQIDIWVVDRALGRGGMGSVYRCHNESATRILAAVKVLDSDINANEDAKARFIREAEILFQLDHPNIVKVRNVRTDTKPAYIEMEFVEGQSLESTIKSATRTQLDALDYVRQISGAIAYMHGKGVCHRDIKPANLLVTSAGVVKLVDFGLAMESDVTRITQHGMAFGTVSYAPPEWINPDKLDPKSWDIYALGVVFYELLLGELAFPVSGQGTVRQQAMQVIIGKQSSPPLDPGDKFHPGKQSSPPLDPGDKFHPEIRRLIREMTDKDPNKRPETSFIVNRQLTKIQEAMSGTPSMNPALPHDPQSNWRTASSAPARVEIPDDHNPLPSETITLPPTRRSPLSVILLAGLLFLLTVAIGASLGAGILLPIVVPSSRNVTLKLNGIPDEVQTLVRLNEQSPIRADGFTHEFGELEPGEYTLDALVGPCGFNQCPGDSCPDWCRVNTSVINVPRGRTPYVVPVNLDGPSRRALNFQLTDIDPKWIGELTVNSQPAEWNNEKKQFEGEPLLPGQYLISVVLGECGREALGCHERQDCPDGCLSSEQSIDLPWGEGAHTIPLDLPEPKPAKKVTAAPQIRKSTPKRGGLVTHSQFSRWLDSNPEWLPEPAIGRNHAKAGYLDGWKGTSPPSGDGAKPMVNASGAAAYQYCNSAGASIPSHDAAPTTWKEGAGIPSFEWRRQGDQLVLLDASGQVIPAPMSASNKMTGFRCAK